MNEIRAGYFRENNRRTEPNKSNGVIFTIIFNGAYELDPRLSKTGKDDLDFEVVHYISPKFLLQMTAYAWRAAGRPEKSRYVWAYCSQQISAYQGSRFLNILLQALMNGHKTLYNGVNNPWVNGFLIDKNLGSLRESVLVSVAYLVRLMLYADTCSFTLFDRVILKPSADFPICRQQQMRMEGSKR